VLVLASASPARRALLGSAGLDPVVRVSAVDEDAELARHAITDPDDVALHLARAKARDVAAGPDLPPGALVLGCDSVLDVDGVAYGKPYTAQEATRRWRQIRGRAAVLRTGHWLVRAGGADGTGAVAATTVHFADVSDAEIAAYVATGEPLAVAGAFTIDGLGGAFVERIEGDHHNVVGVSLPLLRLLVGRLGVAWTDLWRPVGPPPGVGVQASSSD
jgi:nucleoside triphosphate pyrophosphatase